MSILTLLLATFREMFSKATLYILLGISTVVLLGTLLAFSSDITDDGIVLKIFGLPVSPPTPTAEIEPMVFGMQAGLAKGLFVGIMLFGVFATASVIPDALEKGTVDLYLSKPLARWELLLGKYVGSVAVIGLATAYFIAGVWLTFGLRVGVWNIQFLLSSVTMTFMFAAIFSIVLLLGVVFRNAAVAIIGSFLYLMLIDNLLDNRETVLYLVSESSFYRGMCDAFYYLLPQIAGMQRQVENHIMQRAIEWRSFIQPLLSSALMFGVASLVMQKKDF
jgi:ABC-type transport system involved in multi-copper enzyme maturation permease subunit